jgi:hypothetical protein
MKSPTRQGKTKEEFWRKVLARFERSGLSQIEFCTQEGLNPANLSWWKREIAKRDGGVGRVERKKPLTAADSRLTYWRQVLSQFQNSGMSKDDFCRRKGIRPAVFTWWRAEVGRHDGNQDAVIECTVSPTASLFVPVLAEKPDVVLPDNGGPQVIAEIDMSRKTVRIFETVSDSGLAALLRGLTE